MGLHTFSDTTYEIVLIYILCLTLHKKHLYEGSGNIDRLRIILTEEEISSNWLSES